ncbi:hypothetical protein M5D96_003941 [Drosophila gunungcola]|uniref:Uncharacterized protein n=1 Tax=Drosophila gunungcola TaxID=103775 RepID=A0A9P9YTK5_9MUSC|nr:hypothetical protein M5D96_003941 [Drosophila gunungcola]
MSSFAVGNFKFEPSQQHAGAANEAVLTSHEDNKDGTLTAVDTNMRDVSANHSSSFVSSSPASSTLVSCLTPSPQAEKDKATRDKKPTLELKLQSCDEYGEQPKDKGAERLHPAQIANNNASSPLQLKVEEQEQEQGAEEEEEEEEGEAEDLGLTGAAVALYGHLNNASKDVRDLEQCLKLQNPSGE